MDGREGSVQMIFQHNQRVKMMPRLYSRCITCVRNRLSIMTVGEPEQLREAWTLHIQSPKVKNFFSRRRSHEAAEVAVTWQTVTRPTSPLCNVKICGR